MASLGIRCGGNHPLIHNLRSNLDINRTNPNQISRITHSISISNPVLKKPPQRISASLATSNFTTCYNSLESCRKIVNDEDVDDNELMVPEKLDEWMRDSVVDIVKNLRQSPLLLQIYGSSNDNEPAQIKTEKAISENWPNVMNEWKSGDRPSPDGIIFVKELEDKKKLNDDDDDDDVEEGLTKAWGLVVQGKGVRCEPVCYLLKTTRVRAGLELFCTHYCLTRVESFRESALSQLKNCWLVQ